MKENAFRMALSVSTFNGKVEESGVTYTDGTLTAGTAEQLQKIYMEHGSTEMWVRFATKKHHADNDYDKEHPTTNRQYLYDDMIFFCELAAKLGVPINPELMCAYTYMDASTQEKPVFVDYPEIEMPEGKSWEELSLDEMCQVLEQYGEIIARDILNTGCTVNIWDIGNEANFGFAGVNVGLKTIVNPVLEDTDPYAIYAMDHLGADWLAENVWKYNAPMMAAVANGVKKVDPGAKFSTHIGTVVADVYYCGKYFSTLKENGFAVDEAGASFYPSAQGSTGDQVQKIKDIVSIISEQCGVDTFIPEYTYPSEIITTGTYVNWNYETPGYPISEEGQAKLLADLIAWGKENGISGIRPFAPDLLGEWEPMSLYHYNDESKEATAKRALLQLPL